MIISGSTTLSNLKILIYSNNNLFFKHLSEDIQRSNSLLCSVD